MNEPIPLVVGFDQREAVAYHVFCQSVLEHASRPVKFIPLAKNTLSDYRETHTDGSNDFVYSRFLTPWLCGYDGFAIFADGDMVCRSDIAELANLFDPDKAVQVVQHHYKTKSTKKYLGNINENYPRKNWSSLVVWNCGHPANALLTPAFIQQQPGSQLHRFSWLGDDLIGELPTLWNWLAIEYEDNPNAKIIHYTLGTPCFADYRETAMSHYWWEAYDRLRQGIDNIHESR